MPYALESDKRAYIQRRREIIRAYVAAIRESTFCEVCGAQPIDFHREEHERYPNRRVSIMATQGYSIKSIEKEIALCNALCRRCHMTFDGRINMTAYKRKNWSLKDVLRFLERNKSERET